MKTIITIIFFSLLILGITNICFAQYTGDLCTGGAVIFSSQFVTYPAVYAFDDIWEYGPGSNYWESQDDVPQYIGYQFTSAKTIGTIQIFYR